MPTLIPPGQQGKDQGFAADSWQGKRVAAEHAQSTATVFKLPHHHWVVASATGDHQFHWPGMSTANDMVEVLSLIHI